MKDGSRIKTWASFLEDCASAIDHRKAEVARKLIEAQRYLEACEIIRQTMEPHEWNDKCEREFLKTAEPSNLHHALVKLDQRIVLTTNFDKLYEDAWSKVNSGKYYPSIKYMLDDTIFDALRTSRQYIIKIHGTIDDPQSLVFSYDDYAKKAFGNTNYRHFILNLLMNYTFVFVGFSMSDPAVRGVIQDYAVRFPKSRPHYIFSSDEISEEERALEKKYSRLIAIEYSSDNGHAELVDLLDELGGLIRSKRREIVAEEI